MLYSGPTDFTGSFVREVKVENENVFKEADSDRLRHVAFEDLGLLAPLLDDAGWNVSYCDVASSDWRDGATDLEIDRADLVIVLGGPIGVYETAAYPFISDEVRAVERRLARHQATLGICLGSQIMAKALGSRVYAGHQKEIGWGSVHLTDEGRTSCLESLSADDAIVLHWHGDTFDLPKGAVRLASTDLYENQAFAYGSNALALQFHIDADERSLQEWFLSGMRVELAVAGISVPDLRKATARVAGRLESQATRILTGWLRQIEMTEQHVRGVGFPIGGTLEAAIGAGKARKKDVTTR